MHIHHRRYCTRCKIFCVRIEADTHQSLKSLDEIYNIWELLEFLCLFRANLHQEYIYTEHVN